MEFEPPLRLHLDGDALVNNWKNLARLSGQASCGAAVKADGYGLGAREVVRGLSAAGCRDFFVAHWDEAAAIADVIPSEQIAVLNGIDAENLPAILKCGAAPVLNTPGQIAWWRKAGGGRCHVMLDSGINRLGIGPEQFSRDLFEGLQIDILMSHLASADEDVPQNARQMTLFRQWVTAIDAKRRSLANSAGIMLGSDYHFDLTRPGLSLYGGIARPEMADHIAQVVRISARILQVRQLQAGDPVGYNAIHICAAPTRVATIAIGYADGYLRGFSARGTAMSGNTHLPVIGRVSMDLVTIDIGGASGLGEGDWVEIDYDLPTASAVSGLSQYELLTGLGNRSGCIWR